MKNPARYLRRFAIVTAAVLAIIAVLNWRVDPLQHYRAASYPPLLVEQGRFRNPGLARHAPAEIIIAGTSVSAHIEPGDARAVFGKTALNLAMDGASAHEQFLLLRLALRTGHVREVVWDVNYEYLRGKPDWVSDYDGAFPGYLYDDSAWNDVQHYLLNLDTCKNTFRILARRCGIPAYKPRTTASFQEFESTLKYGPASIAQSIERRRKRKTNFRTLLPEFTRELLRDSFEKNYLALAHEFPTVKFRLYFPPFSAAYFQTIREIAPELIPVFLQSRDDVFAATRALPNVELHDLQSDIALITDASHYSDPIHFDPATHSLVLEWIHDGSHLASPERLATVRDFVERSVPQRANVSP